MKSEMVFLKLNDGLWTRKTPIPDSVLTGVYRVPVRTGLKMSSINVSQAIMSDLNKVPVLVFKYLGDEKQGYKVLELIDVENI